MPRPRGRKPHQQQHSSETITKAVAPPRGERHQSPRTSTAASVIVGATPYKARARQTRNPVSLRVCTTSDAPTAMIAPASVGTSSRAVSKPQHNRRPGRPPTRRTRTAPASPPGLAAPGRTRLGARKERGGLTELNGAYQGREGTAEVRCLELCPPGDHVGPSLRPRTRWCVHCPGGGGVWTSRIAGCYRCWSPASGTATFPGAAAAGRCWGRYAESCPGRPVPTNTTAVVRAPAVLPRAGAPARPGTGRRRRAPDRQVAASPGPVVQGSTVETQQRPDTERNRDCPACPRSARFACWTK